MRAVKALYRPSFVIFVLLLGSSQKTENKAR